VLLNLLSNAVKYNRPDGTVRVDCQPTTDDWLSINVTDTGVGISADRFPMLFTAFDRLGAEQGPEEGAGIGLALSKRLAEAMGGQLEASSKAGRGSTFTLLLPRVEAPLTRYERMNPEVSPRAGDSAAQHVVLHIEDNLANLTLVEKILEQRPEIGVVAAMQGRLGLSIATAHHPDVVLLDLHLPDMPGERVLESLRADPATATIPVIIVSADATHGQVQRLLDAGAVAYLTKPIDSRALLRLIDNEIPPQGDEIPQR
jgi:CheY-like chemotaxis protein